MTTSLTTTSCRFPTISPRTNQQILTACALTFIVFIRSSATLRPLLLLLSSSSIVVIFGVEGPRTGSCLVNSGASVASCHGFGGMTTSLTTTWFGFPTTGSWCIDRRGTTRRRKGFFKSHNTDNLDTPLIMRRCYRVGNRIGDRIGISTVAHKLGWTKLNPVRFKHNLLLQKDRVPLVGTKLSILLLLLLVALLLSHCKIFAYVAGTSTAADLDVGK
mmetsp:Transcript_18223/g.31044  ORF Transcript_18223/g.31044 Transcript_18223/m.31044 type:complete len:217 (+) Transcript_18223:389-1039(+)